MVIHQKAEHRALVRNSTRISPLVKRLFVELSVLFNPCAKYTSRLGTLVALLSLVVDSMTDNSTQLSVPSACFHAEKRAYRKLMKSNPTNSHKTSKDTLLIVFSCGNLLPVNTFVGFACNRMGKVKAFSRERLVRLRYSRI